jgi:Ca2+-binding RTX toxin-like protein
MNIRDALRAGTLTLAAPALLVAGAASTGAGGGTALAADNVSPSAVVANGTLTVTGTNGADAIHAGLGATPNTFFVDFGNGDVRTFDSSTFVSISVFLGNGDDSFSVPVAGQFADKRLSVFGENGTDSLSGSRGADVLDGGNGDDAILGSDGNDLITGDRGDDVVDGEKGTDTELLGSGSDVAVWLPGEGSDNVDGDSGADALNFIGADAAETMALTANGNHAVFTRQPGSVVMDTVDVETLNLRALGGADAVTLNDVHGTALDTVNVDLSSAQGNGDNAGDTLTVNGTAAADNLAVTAQGSAVTLTGGQPSVHVTGAEPTDRLQINTGDGNDAVLVTDAARALITVAVDLGSGQL